MKIHTFLMRATPEVAQVVVPWDVFGDVQILMGATPEGAQVVAAWDAYFIVSAGLGE